MMLHYDLVYIYLPFNAFPRQLCFCGSLNSLIIPCWETKIFFKIEDMLSLTRGTVLNLRKKD